MPASTPANVTIPAPAAGQPGAALRALLQRADLSPEQFARLLGRIAADQGLARPLDSKTPYKWLRGGVPRYPWSDLAAFALTARLGTPVTAADLGWHPGRTTSPPFLPAGAGLDDLPWTPAGALTAISLVTDTKIGIDRAYLPVSGAALAAPALDWLTAGPPGDPARAAGREAGPELAGDLDAITARLRRTDARHGGGQVLPLARDCARHLAGILRDSSYATEAGQRLYAAAADLHALCGWLALDAGRPSLAHRHHLAGLRAAHAAADPAAAAGILAAMSAHASDTGHPGPALQLARAARHACADPAPRLAAAIIFAAARAHAAARDPHACRAALAAARTALAAAGPGIPEPGGAGWLDHPAASIQAGTAFLALGDHDQARRSLTTALAALDPDARARDTATACALLALAHAGQAQPDRACHSADQALAILTRTVDSGRCAAYLRQLCDTLRPYHRTHPAITTLTTRTATLHAPRG